MTDFERIAMEQWLEEEKHILEAESGFCLLTWGPSTNCKLFTVLPKMCKTMEKNSAKPKHNELMYPEHLHIFHL